MLLANVLLLSLTYSQVFSNDLLRGQFPIFGLSELAAKESAKESSNLCKNQLKTIYYGIKKHENWALKILDASGSPINGFFWGNNYWLGKYSWCRSLKSMKRTPSFYAIEHHQPPFELSFQIGLFQIKNSTYSTFDSGVVQEGIIHLGLCLPKSCTTDDLKTYFGKWASQNLLTVRDLYNFTMVFQSSRIIEYTYTWMYSPIAITLGILTVVVFLLTLSGTIYEIYVWTPIKIREALDNERKTNNKTQEVLKTRNIRECSELLNRDNNLNECYELKIDNSQHKSMPIHIIKTLPQPYAQGKPKENFLTKLSLCFSLTSNLKQFFKLPEINNQELSVVHGLRFFGMNWLIWLYVGFYLQSYSGNSKNTRLQDAPHSSFSIDTFLFTSGFMLTYKYYVENCRSQRTDRNFSVKKKVNEFGFTVLGRFLRLTPTYLIVMFAVIISIQITRKLSLFEVTPQEDILCGKAWWRNIAYINNLFGGNELCMSWSWYLATEMQYFLLGLFILILSTRFYKFVTFLLVTLIILSALITGYYGIYFKAETSNVLIFSPWTRITPYVIGMITGYFIIDLKGGLSLRRTTLVACWTVGILCGAWALFGLTTNASVIFTIIHTALSRMAWSFAMAWIVIASCTGNAGIIKSILSFFMWTSFNKLFYSSYLITPLVIILLITNAETAKHLDPDQMVVYFFGSISIIYLVSFFLSTFVEIPLSKLQKQFFGPKQRQNQLNQSS